MKIKQILYLAVAMLSVTACSSDDASQPQGERVPIGLSYTTQPQTMSRAAAATNLNDGTIASGKQVKVFISNHLEDDYKDYVYTTGDAGAMVLPSPAPYYPLDGITNVDILAFYPATAGTSFTVLADQTSDNNYTASDLMWATPITNQARTTSNVALEFTHKMAKLVVTARKGTAIKEVNSVTLMNVKPTVSFNQTDGTIGAASGDAIEVKMVKDETADIVTGAAVFPAQTIDGQLLKIGVTMTNDETGFAYYSVDSKSFAANSVYTVDLTVSWPEVSATTAITSWGNGGTAAVTHSSQFLTFNVNGVEFKMVYVEGTDEDIPVARTEYHPYEGGNGTTLTYPNIKYKGVSSFYIGQTEVTNALWYAVMGSKPPKGSGHKTGDGQETQDDRYPVAWISYPQICTSSTGFIDKLNSLVASQLPNNMKFNLQSELQFTYASKGGKYSNGYTYIGGNSTLDTSWILENSNDNIQPSATKPANELGIYDMGGNLWELCRDDFAFLTNNQELAKDYVRITNSSYVTLHGGCWFDATDIWTNTPGAAHAWYRSRPTYNVGFRLVLEKNN